MSEMGNVVADIGARIQRREELFARIRSWVRSTHGL